MTQDIRLKGITSNPSDYVNPDGDLSESINLIHEDGALHPISQPSQSFQLQTGEHLWCIHRSPTFDCDHYIVSTINGTIKWITVGESVTRTNTNIQVLFIIGIECIGNTLCVLGSTGVHYLLWDPELNSQAGNYRYLSDGFPSLDISFGLQGDISTRDLNMSSVDLYTYAPCDITQEVPKLTADSRKLLGNGFNTAANLLMADVRDAGKFCLPFFVRYAFRLYDGSLTRQSAPILMVPTSNGCPYAVMQCTIANQAIHTKGIVSVPALKLDYAAIFDSAEMAAYEDIIESVDIFVSAPLYSYVQDGEAKFAFRNRDTGGWGIWKHTGLESVYYDIGRTSVPAMLSWYSKRKIDVATQCQTGFSMQGGITSGVNMKYDMCIIPESKKESIKKAMYNDCSTFYHVCSIPIEDLSSSRVMLDIDGGVLTGLTGRETMPDDYNSHDKLVATDSFSYNSRLMLSGVSTGLFNGYFSMPYADGYIYGTPDPQHPLVYDLAFAEDGDSNLFFAYSFENVGSESGRNQLYRVKYIFTYIKRNGVSYIVKQDAKSMVEGSLLNSISISAGTPGHVYTEGSLRRELLPHDMCLPYLYHPDGNAYKMEIILERTSGPETTTLHRATINLKKHDMMNGAFYFGNYDVIPIEDITQSDIPTPSTSQLTSMPNQLYVSDANNPFIFPPTGIVTIGTGSILGVSTAARPLSQGQFGSFPLYAFCTDGVWALAVSSTGSFSAVQPISREVCISSQGILQLDTSVLFATKRGLMHLSGSEVKCISDSLDGAAFDLSSLPGIADAYGHIGITSLSGFAKTPLSEFLDGCRMVYDYMHQHVVIYNNTSVGGTPKYRYALVFSTKSLSFGCMLNDINYGVRSYPDAISVSKSQVVCNWSANASASPLTGLFITRPIKLGGPDVFKTLRTAVLRGVFSNGGCGLAIYGSRDLAHWSLVGSCISHHLSRLGGTPYKYFRIVGITALTEGQSVSGVSAEFDVRDARQLR